jgi:hypothetical protein
MNQDQKQITDIFLKDVEGEKLVISSPLENSKDGSSTFNTTNPKTKETYKITFKIEEV